MFAAGPSGFQHAPITKVIVVITTAVTIIAHFLSLKDSLNLPNISSILPTFQLWRLVTQLTFFSSVMESAIGILLLYKFRIIERRFGSRKFSGFVFIVYILSVVFQLAFQVLLPSVSLVPGPYVFIFACFVLSHKLPYSETFSLFRIPFTDKTILYVLGLQFLIFHFPSSLPLAAIGIMLGFMYQTKAFGFDSIQLPDPIENFCKDFIAPFFGVPRSRNTITIYAKLQSRRSLNNNYFQSQRLNTPLHPQFNSNQHQPNHSPILNQQAFTNFMQAIPTEENISSLQGMGFSRDESLYALSQTGNNLQLAMNVLLDGGN